MAFFPIDHSARGCLAALPDVTIIDRPSPHRAGDITLALSGLRCCEVFATSDAFRPAYHLRLGEWLPLAEAVAEPAVVAAIFNGLGTIRPAGRIVGEARPWLPSLTCRR